MSLGNTRRGAVASRSPASGRCRSARSAPCRTRRIAGLVHVWFVTSSSEFVRPRRSHHPKHRTSRITGPAWVRQAVVAGAWQLARVPSSPKSSLVASVCPCKTSSGSAGCGDVAPRGRRRRLRRAGGMLVVKPVDGRVLACRQAAVRGFWIAAMHVSGRWPIRLSAGHTAYTIFVMNRREPSLETASRTRVQRRPPASRRARSPNKRTP